VRRLFSTFAHGVPGFGLLLLRLTISITLINRGVLALIAVPPLAAPVFYSFLTLLGVLLLVGFWTPIVGALVGLSVIWEAHSHLASWEQCALIGMVAVALTLLGPGALSVDAWLYGWKQITISDRTGREDPPD
jgi:putative oxidoreductase